MGAKEPKPRGALQDFYWMDVELLIPCPENPRFRKEGEAFEELKRSIAEQGIIEPLIARPHPKVKDHYDLRCGHRRLAAAKAVGQADVPVIVRTHMSDAEAVELTVAENLHRENLHPLEEAVILKALADTGLDEQAIAERTSQSERSVRRKLKLAAIDQGVRKAMLDADHPLGRVTQRYIERVGTVPKSIQQELLKTFDTHYRYEQIVDIADLEDWLAENYLVDLAKAKFEKDDAGLYPKAGSCTDCPKRTGKDPLLFDDLPTSDLGKVKKGKRKGEAKLVDACMDKACYDEKLKRYVQIKVQAARTEQPETMVIHQIGSWQQSELKDLKKRMGLKDKDFASTSYGEWTTCRAKDKGARPAVYSDGAQAGQKTYIRSTSTARRDTGGKGKKKSLKEKMDGLNKRRQLWIVEKVKDRLQNMLDGDEDLIFRLQPGDPASAWKMALGLVVTFGACDDTAYERQSRASDFAGAREMATDLTPTELVNKAMAGVYEVWIRKLQYARYSAETAYAEALQMAPYVGLEVAGLKQEAIHEIPTPKAWQEAAPEAKLKTAVKKIVPKKPKKAKKGKKGKGKAKSASWGPRSKKAG